MNWIEKSTKSLKAESNPELLDQNQAKVLKREKYKDGFGNYDKKEE